MSELIQSGWSHYAIIGCSVVGLVWGGINAMFVSHKPELTLSTSAVYSWQASNRHVLISLG